MKFEQKCTEISAELDDILQKIEIDYTFVQDPTVVDKIPQS